MRLKCLSFISLLFVTISWGAADAGILKSLNQELTALVAQTDPYLVTVRGEDKWRNLIASGIICDQEGHLITSAQVCEAGNFTVTFKDGRTFSATKIGTDKQSGLAILKIIGERFTVPKWGRANKLNQGDWITVVGNSYGVPATVNFGYFDVLVEDGLLGLSVNASPGSSGGAVLNIDGQVVGVLVAREASVQEAEDSMALSRVSNTPYSMRLLGSLGNPGGRCYAVSMEMALNIARQIIESGKVHRGFLGISSQSLEPSAAAEVGFRGGVVVTGLDDNSPAAQAGICKGDIITSVDSTEVSCRASLLSLVHCHQPGDIITLAILRDRGKINTRVTLGEAKEDPLMSRLNLSQVHTSLNFADDHASADTSIMKTDLIKLKTEVARLQIRMDELEHRIK